MTYHNFFNKIPTIKLQDDLASFLGAFEDGIIEYSYLDVVKKVQDILALRFLGLIL